MFVLYFIVENKGNYITQQLVITS